MVTTIPIWLTADGAYEAQCHVVTLKHVEFVTMTVWFRLVGVARLLLRVALLCGLGSGRSVGRVVTGPPGRPGARRRPSASPVRYRANGLPSRHHLPAARRSHGSAPRRRAADDNREKV